MRNKTSFKLIFLIFSISFLVTSISIYIQITNQYEQKVINFEKSLESVKENLIPMLSQSLWSIDEAGINIFLNNLINDERIVYAKIIENDGNIISIGKIKELNTIKKEFEITKKFGKDNHYIGKLVVIADLSSLYNELEDNAISIIFTELVKMFLISLSIVFVMKRLLTNKLEQMSDYANHLSLKNLHEPLVITSTKGSKNEFDILTKAINKMRKKLIKQIQESEEQNNIISQQSKLAAMGEMIGNIAHQWRQPLSLITTASSGMQLNSQMDQLDKEKVNDFTEKIINAANYLSHTIDDFRDFFKPNKEKCNFNLSKTFEKTFTLLNTQFDANNITVVKNINDIEVYGFENELIQVLINILNNAKDELIKKENHNSLIFINTSSSESEVVISIKDNAGGIEDSLIDRIFEPYFTTKEKAQGTGIGLYMSQEIIVKHMKGALIVENKDFKYEDVDYRGAEFKIIIDVLKKEND